MTDLSTVPIPAKWPAQHPDRLQLYSLPTPNGVKVSIALEELGLPYEALPDHSVADIAIFPWVSNLVCFYEAGDLMCFAEFPEVARVLAAFVVLPAVVRGLAIPG